MANQSKPRLRDSRSLLVALLRRLRPDAYSALHSHSSTAALPPRGSVRAEPLVSRSVRPAAAREVARSCSTCRSARSTARPTAARAVGVGRVPSEPDPPVSSHTHVTVPVFISV
jgi:hypothetical protein